MFLVIQTWYNIYVHIHPFISQRRVQMKKHPIRFSLSVLLTAAILSQSTAALSFTGIGEITSIKRDMIGDGLTYAEYSSESQKTYIFEYDPKGDVLPLVRYGNTVYGKDRLASMVSAEWEADKVVLGAINGDFYSMQTGVPLGVMIDNGALISTDDSKYAIGFTSEGTAIIGKPEIKLSLTNLTRGSDAVGIDQLNKFPTQWGIYLLTEDFASTTLSASESLEVIIRLDGNIKASGSVEGTIVEVIHDDYNSSIPEGCAVLTVANSFEGAAAFANLTAGDRVRINASCADGWQNVRTAIGGGDLILNGGILPEGIIDEEHEKVSNPRTAVGIKADGTVVFFAIDGRNAASRGLTETELSSVMAELGCVNALNLDGGGSTTVMVKHSTATESVYVNMPAEGSYRSISNGMLFVSKKASDGKFAEISPVPNTPTVLSNSSVSFSAQPLDAAYMPTGTLISSDNLNLEFSPDYTYDPNAGTVSGGTFTAGSIPGEYRLKVTTASNILVKAESEVSVIVTDTIDALNVTPSYKKTSPGSLVELSIDATYKGKSVICDPASFYYTLNGEHIVPDQKDYPGAVLLCDVGYLDENGNFQTFGNREGEVEIGVWFGDFVEYVKISVGDGSEVVADFETATQFADFRISSAGNDLYFAPASFGFKTPGALEAGFSYTGAENARVLDIQLREGFPIAETAESIKLWVSGDISGVLTATVLDENGTPYTLSYTVTKDYSQQLGWRELTATIPSSLKTGTLTLTSLLSVNASGTAARSITIDEAIVYYGEEITPALSGLEEHWGSDAMLRLYDMGVIQNYDCEQIDGALYLDPDKAVSRGNFAKILSLWLGYNAYAYENGVPLDDSTPADKIPYIRSMIANGLMSGRSTDENGVVQFDANAEITREEAFKVIGALLTASENGIIFFSDASEISDWARTGIMKCINAGILQGYEDNTIRPNGTISFAELAALLGRM